MVVTVSLCFGHDQSIKIITKITMERKISQSTSC